ncbi:MAG: glucose-6-phosphate dehydrogenase [Enterobacterales bacterium]
MVKYNLMKPCNLIIFGAKGDLAKRKLFPSLYQLEKLRLIKSQFRIICIGRDSCNILKYINIVRTSLENFIDEKIDEKFWEILKNRLDFCNININNTKSFTLLYKKLKKSITNIYYLATPYTVFGQICKGLGLFGLNTNNSRIVVEKPLGTNLVSSININNQISKYFNENQIYRIDHYLGKEAILNLMYLRFANNLFISNWDNKSIDHVQITVAEQIGIENRWDYFDKVGQMKDMLQSHLLQILSIITMSPPSDFTADKIRDEKIKILHKLKPISYKNVYNSTVKGQYTQGFIKELKVPGYLEENGSTKNSYTETFVAIKVDIDDHRWLGVPFYLRTGKRLPIKYSEIVIYYKHPPFNLFRKYYKILPQNKLTIRLYKNEGIDIQILNKVPEFNQKYKLENAKLNLNFSEIYNKNYNINEYGKLLLEIMNGMQSLFLHRNEIEAAWTWVDSITDAWQYHNIKPQYYKAGTWGPLDSIKMIKKDGRNWNIINNN